jgi:malate synthase
MTTDTAVQITGRERGDRFEEILTPPALAFVAELQRGFGARRAELLEARAERRRALEAGATLDFLPETREIREGDWRVAEPPADLRDRRAEITGPVERKMVINALNSGARCFMADFEDSCAPTWENLIAGQVNMVDAVAGTIAYDAPDGRSYRLGEETATLIVRPRGWHMDERHALVDGEPVAGALLDAGLFLFHNAAALLERGSGPYLYLPKMESHLEARLWAEAFAFAQSWLELPAGSIRATVLVETLPAAFEMDEILYELRDHVCGLNAGRWDYIFSAIKCLRGKPEAALPDRAKVTMTVPFMRAYTELLVQTCHRRGAHAMGGMSAFIPSRRDAELNERATAAVRADKAREAGDGFDGTWVAHPDLVPVAIEQFDAVLGGRPNQVERLRDDVSVGAAELLALDATPGGVTEEGLRSNVNVAIQYLSSWLRGNGAAAIANLMEDAATAEIARTQVWQWVRHGTRLDDGRAITRALVEQVVEEELAAIEAAVGEDAFRAARPEDARALFERVALGDPLEEFLTTPAYDVLLG